jgi:protein O-mannosyl-transferase
VGASDDAGRRRLLVYLPLALVLLTLAGYLPALRNGFVAWDDPQYVYQSPHVLGGLTPAGLRWALTAQVAGHWHPLALASHMLDVELFGLNAKGHHLTSLLLHLGAVLALYEVLRRATGAALRSAAVAALFAIHPTHVESVAWVAERKDVLCGLLWMLTLAAWVRYARAPSPGRYLLTAAAFTASLMAKAMAVSLPFVLLLLDFWPLARWPPPASAPASPAPPPRFATATWWRLAAEKLPFAGLAAAVAGIALHTQAEPLAAGADAPLAMRTANALTSYVAYLAKTLNPSHLSAFYPFQEVPASRAAAAAGLLLAITLLAALAVRKAPYLLVGWLWYLVTLLPVCGVLLAGWQGMADRYTYLPAIGLYLAAVWGVADLGARWLAVPGDVRRPGLHEGAAEAKARPALRRTAIAALAVLGALLLVELTVMTRRQVGYWSDTLTLFQHALAVQESYVAHTNVAEELRRRGDRAGALAHYRAAATLAPRSPLAKAALGNALRVWGRPAEALTPLREALAIDPRDERARLILAMAYDDLGRPDLAVAELQRVLADHPDSAGARRGLADLLRQRRGNGAAAATPSDHPPPAILER